MTVDEAFRFFHSQLAHAKLGAPTEVEYPEAFGSRYSEITKDGASARLAFDGRDYSIVLEITHGPENGPIFWLDLYRASTTDGVLDESDVGQESFGSCVEYAIELFNP
jgi:hypothetical protein